MKTYVITILENGALWNEVIFTALDENEAIERLTRIYLSYNKNNTMHLSEYFGNGRKGKMIVSSVKVNA